MQTKTYYHNYADMFIFYLITWHVDTGNSSNHNADTHIVGHVLSYLWAITQVV